jgi:acyl dehydratase
LHRAEYELFWYVLTRSEKTMSEHCKSALSAWRSCVGKHEGTGRWHRVEQTQIDAFAEATFDRQFIHVDPVRAAAASPYGVTVAHGYLTLSLLPYLLDSALPVVPALTTGRIAAINYGVDRVRFPAPVKVGSRVRASSELLSVAAVDMTTLQLKRRVTIEIEGSTKPGCVAEPLLRLVYS